MGVLRLGGLGPQRKYLLIFPLCQSAFSLPMFNHGIIMNYYQFHIGDFNNSTRHLTRVERSVYRDLIDLYYDKESPLTSDLSMLSRKVMATSDDEYQALLIVLSEYFTLEDDGYHHERCDKQIKEYQGYIEAKARAGKASAAKRKQNSTRVEQNDTVCATNQEPLTINQEPNKKHTSNKFDDWWKLYPKKVEKKKALAIWKRRKLDDIGDRLIEDVRNRTKNDRKWIDGYIPNPTTYLNGDRWEDQIDTTRGNNNGPHQGQSTSRSKRFSDELDEIARRDIEQNGFTDKLG